VRDPLRFHVEATSKFLSLRLRKKGQIEKRRTLQISLYEEHGHVMRHVSDENVNRINVCCKMKRRRCHEHSAWESRWNSIYREIELRHGFLYVVDKRRMSMYTSLSYVVFRSRKLFLYQESALLPEWNTNE